MFCTSVGCRSLSTSWTTTVSLAWPDLDQIPRLRCQCVLQVQVTIFRSKWYKAFFVRPPTQVVHDSLVFLFCTSSLYYRRFMATDDPARPDLLSKNVDQPKPHLWTIKLLNGLAMIMRLREISLQAKHTAERKRAESIFLSDFQNKKQECILHCQKIVMVNHTEDGKLNYSGTKISACFLARILLLLSLPSQLDIWLTLDTFEQLLLSNS